MNRHTLPRALFSALVAGAAAAQPAVALPPLNADLVDELTLSQISGKYYGANMLVGLRIDVTSTLHTAQQGTATASGSLSIRRSGNGFEVSIDSRTGAVAGTGVAPATGGGDTAQATGGEAIQVNGIGQVTQIAGDGNRMANVTTIRFQPEASANTGASGFNGLASSHASDGAVTAHVTFLDGGMQLGVSAPGTTLAQQFRLGGGGIMQLGQIAGNGVAGSNQLQLELATSAMSADLQRQLGVQQALSGLTGLGR